MAWGKCLPTYQGVMSYEKKNQKPASDPLRKSSSPGELKA